MSVFAYGEAVRHLEQALKIQDVLDPDDKAKRCDLLLALGEAMLPMESPERVADTVAEEALGLAEALGDSPRAARVAVQALEAISRSNISGEAQLTVVRSPEFREWVGRADRHAQEGSAERVYADLSQSGYVQNLPGPAGGPAAGHVFRRRAVGLAFELEDPAPFFSAAALCLNGMTSLRDRELIDRVVREVLRRPHEGVRSRVRSFGVCALLRCGFWRGHDLSSR